MNRSVAGPSLSPDRTNTERVILGDVPVASDHWIDGRWVTSSRRMDVRSPIDDSLLGAVAAGGEKEIGLAIEAARRAYRSWATMSLADRRDHLHRLGETIERHAEDFATVECYDTGLPLQMLRRYLSSHISRHITYFADVMAEAEEEIITAPESINRIRYDPSGIAAIIGPWNGPLSVVTAKLGAALAVGNTVVVKPPEWAPFSCALLGEVSAEAGLPVGVINIVQGTGAEAGAALVASPEIARISFTGSPATARSIARACAENLVPTSLELGGKSPVIVCEDVECEEAGSAIAAQYFHAGQICAAGTRILVESAVSEQLMNVVLERIERLRIGDPRDPETEVGPLITRQHLERVDAIVDRARQAGAEVVCGGDRLGSSGLYYQPTLITGIRPDMEVWQREIFGPVLVWDTFDSDDEAISKANSTEYGLAAHVWGRSTERITDLAARLVAGTVWLNCSNLVLDISVPFGGARSSGIGREGGRWSIEFFADVKNVARSNGDGTSALLRRNG